MSSEPMVTSEEEKTGATVAFSTRSVVALLGLALTTGCVGPAQPEASPSDQVESSIIEEGSTEPEKPAEPETPSYFDLRAPQVMGEDGLTVTGFPQSELQTVEELYPEIARAVLYVNSDMAMGTAFLVRPDLALTNEHGTFLLTNRERVRMYTFDGDEIYGRVAAENMQYDLALIELDEPVDIEPLKLIELDLPNDAREPLFSIGHPAMLPGNSNEGWVTFVGLSNGYGDTQPWRLRTTLEAIGGQSGSPILTLDREVVGILSGGSGWTLEEGPAVTATEPNPLSYNAPWGLNGGASASVIRWFIEQFDNGDPTGTMPGWRGFVKENEIVQSQVEVPPQFSDPTSPVTVSGFPKESLPVVEDAYSRLSPSVVKVDVRGENNFLAGGAGWFYSRDLVITNHHIVEVPEGIGRVSVVTKDWTKIAGEVIAWDKELDIALIQLSREADVEPLTIADYRPGVDVPVWYIGHPYSHPKLWATGVGVVAPRGELDFDGVLKATVPVVEGVSGSPIFDLNGDVVALQAVCRSGAPDNLVPIGPEFIFSYMPPSGHCGGPPANDLVKFLESNLPPAE